MSLIVGIFIGRCRRFGMEHIIGRFLRKGVQVKCYIIFYTFILCEILCPIKWLHCHGRTIFNYRSFLRNLFSHNSVTQNLKIADLFLCKRAHVVYFIIL